jgi:hypothetical protein
LLVVRTGGAAGSAPRSSTARGAAPWLTPRGQPELDQSARIASFKLVLRAQEETARLVGAQQVLHEVHDPPALQHAPRLLCDSSQPSPGDDTITAASHMANAAEVQRHGRNQPWWVPGYSTPIKGFHPVAGEVCDFHL